MKIGILMAGGYGLEPFTDGRKVLTHKQANALERIGHHVVRMNPWESYPLETFDAIHLVEGGVGNIPGTYGPILNVRKMGMSIFLDTNRASWLYRLIGYLGQIHPRFMTHQGVICRQAKVCAVIIAKNRVEKRLLVQGLGIPEEKVKVVFDGVDAPGPVEPERVREELGLHGDFIFHVSMFTQPRKNVCRLIQAAQLLGLPLVIAGTAGDAAATQVIYRAAEGHGKVRFLGQITALQRDSLYAACRVFALPSLFEGIGLVALEAGVQGANVVATQSGGPPDYFGDHVDYVNPKSVTSIRDALARAWNRPRDGKLRDHLLTNLTWEASARSLATAYGF
jgi:glycosyltransferase involved in cell wall biosynthesis